MLSQIGAAFADPDEAQLGQLAGVVFGPIGERFHHGLVDGDPACDRCSLEPGGDLVGNREGHHWTSLCAFVTAALLTFDASRVWPRSTGRPRWCRSLMIQLVVGVSARA